MRLSQDIKSVSYVKANTTKILEQVNTCGPVVITQNGEASAVLMGFKDFDDIQETMALMKILSQGSKSIEEGRGVPAETVLGRLRERIREEEERRG